MARRGHGRAETTDALPGHAARRTPATRDQTRHKPRQSFTVDLCRVFARTVSQTWQRTVPRRLTASAGRLRNRRVGRQPGGGHLRGVTPNCLTCHNAPPWRSLAPGAAFRGIDEERQHPAQNNGSERDKWPRVGPERFFYIKIQGVFSRLKSG